MDAKSHGKTGWLWGEINTRFFHLYTISRRLVNGITSIYDGNQCIVGQENVSNHFFQIFSAQFNPEPIEHHVIINNISTVFLLHGINSSLKVNAQLDRFFTHESGGAGGVLSSFLNSGFLLKEENKTFITLIPNLKWILPNQLRTLGQLAFVLSFTKCFHCGKLNL